MLVFKVIALLLLCPFLLGVSIVEAIVNYFIPKVAVLFYCAFIDD